MASTDELYEAHRKAYPQQSLCSATFTVVLHQLIGLSSTINPDSKRKDVICEVLHYMVKQQVNRNEMSSEEGRQLDLLICIQIDEYYDHHSSTCCLLS
jgi:hypothetical protein